MTVEPIVRTPELQAHLEMMGTLHAIELLSTTWAIATNKEQWLAVSNALWQASRVSEDLHLQEAAEILANMADLASIRAELEVT